MPNNHWKKASLTDHQLIKLADVGESNKYCYTEYNTIRPKHWISWHLKSLATTWFVQQLVQTNNKENTRASHYWSFVRGFHLWLVDLPHEEPVVAKAISCHNAIIHYNDIIMSAMVSQITTLTIVYSTVCSRCRSKKTSKLRITGLCAKNLPMTSEFSAQRAVTRKRAVMLPGPLRSEFLQNDGGIWPLSSTCFSCRFIEWNYIFVLNLNKDFMFQI